MKIVNVVGARPNYMKIAPLVEAMSQHGEIKQMLVHTEQHYDENMSKLFFEDLGLPRPDLCLGIGSGSHAQQTAKIMIEFEKILLQEKPDLTLVVGDVNSTIACALTSVKLNIPVAHVEAGLRSFDMHMPEEINRIITDSISDYLFVTEESGIINLLREGKNKKNIFFVGNVMIDTLLNHIDKAKKSKILESLSLESHEYAVLTLHRPSNVDDPIVFEEILEAIDEIKKMVKIVYPIHPRTRKKIFELGLHKKYPFLDNQNSSINNCILTEPLGYIDFLHLMANSRFVLTDSGGMQEETTVLGIPCLTLRNNTERPVTISQGTNILTGTSKCKIIEKAQEIISSKIKKGEIPNLWDGHAAQRIVEILLRVKL